MESNSISIIEEKEKAVVVDTTNYMEKAKEYLTAMGSKLPEKQKTQFLELASAFKLNPFKREIYAVGYGDNWNIITGYEVYIKRAERTGKLDGWSVAINGSGENMAATLTIHRNDWKFPFSHTVLFSEVCQKNKEGKLNPIWAKMPSFMCKKVAIAQGFRLCFPDEFSGMPYTADELPEIKKDDDLRNVTPEETKAEPKKENPKKYTKAQAEELGKVMKATYPDGNPIFSDDEISSYRKMLMEGYFDNAIESAKDLYNKRMAEPKTEEIEAELF